LKEEERKPISIFFSFFSLLRATSFGISIALLLLGLLIPFIFWYRPLYKAVRFGNSLLWKKRNRPN